MESRFGPAAQPEDHPNGQRDHHRHRVTPGDPEQRRHHVSDEKAATGKLTDGRGNRNRPRHQTLAAGNRDLPGHDRHGHAGKRQQSRSPQTVERVTGFGGAQAGDNGGMVQVYFL